MKITHILMGWILAWMLASPAQAHHVVWLDFSGFGLGEFASVNGNSPPTANDVAQVRQQVIANITEDYAPFDIYFTTAQPANGRYTHVRILDDERGSPLFGDAGECSDCTGLGSWDDVTVSLCEVYAGSFSNIDSFDTAAERTTARIANGISHTTSHELGHILGLRHCRAADDSFTLPTGCDNITTTTSDQNTRWHIMATDDWSLSNEERASRDRFFGIHAERRILLSNLQVRNHWNLLQNVNAGAGLSDLTYGRVTSALSRDWFVRLSNGNQFENVKQWTTTGSLAAIGAADLFYTADVTGDNRADLVYGFILNATQVQWLVKPSLLNDTFGSTTIWRQDAGDPGDIFRLADVNGDGRADLVYGRPLSADVVRWYVRLSTGNGFGDVTAWVNDAGSNSDLFLIGDVDDDGDADLVYGRPGSNWYLRRSSGSSFGALENVRNTAGATGDLFFLPDLTGNGAAELVSARVNSDTVVQWTLHIPDSITSIDFDQSLAQDAGDAGDIFRFGYAGGDTRTDLFYGRPLGMTSLTATPDLSLVRWYGRPALVVPIPNGISIGFGTFTTWRSDAGDEGDTFP